MIQYITAAKANSFFLLCLLTVDYNLKSMSGQGCFSLVPMCYLWKKKVFVRGNYFPAVQEILAKNVRDLTQECQRWFLGRTRRPFTLKIRNIDCLITQNLFIAKAVRCSCFLLFILSLALSLVSSFLNLPLSVCSKNPFYIYCTLNLNDQSRYLYKLYLKYL